MIETGELGSILSGKFPALGIPKPGGISDDTLTSFADLVSRELEKVQELGEERDQFAIDLALGKPVELHQVMLAATKAQLALELFIELRNKLIEAYQEISRMPV